MTAQTVSIFTPNSKPLYTGLDTSLIDISMLRDSLDAIHELHEGLRVLCKGVMAMSSDIEEMAVMRITLAALDAIQPHLSAIYPDVCSEVEHE
jgi:hypothetical protein